MKRVDEIKGVRQQRMFDKRMDAHKAIKRRQMEIELMKVQLINWGICAFLIIMIYLDRKRKRK